LDIIKIWEGGLASHGGAIGIIIALIIFSRRNNISYWWTLDRIAIVTALAGFFIRMGNLMNSEIFGKVTDLSWGFIFVRAANPALSVDPRHPTQIYEGLSYLLIFIILMVIYYRTNGKFREGLTISLFMILVFASRFFIEFLKEPQVGFERNMTLNMGQILSIPFVLLGIAGLLIIYGRKKEG
jgi:prolipoprotein diacylglyceryl transferase